MLNKMTSFKADLILFFVAISWGTTFATSKYTLTYLEPLTIVAIRFILAVIFMLLFMSKDLKGLSKEDIKGGSIVGLFLFLAFAIQLSALRDTEPGKQAFIAATYVIFTPFLVWLLSKKRPDNRSFIGAFLCLVGIAFLSINKNFTMGSGDSMTLISSVFFALQIIATEKYVKKSTPAKIAFVQFLLVAVLSTVLALIFEHIPKQLPLTTILSLVYLGFVCTGVAYYLQTFAQQYTKSTHAAILMSLESIFGSLFAILFFGEIFTSRMVVGSSIIFISILVIELNIKKPKPLLPVNES